MHTPISKQARAELLAALRQRYLSAPKCEKSKALDEFVAVAGCHRRARHPSTRPHRSRRA